MNNYRHNLSVDKYFCELAMRHKPAYRFCGQTKSDWLRWRNELLPKVKDSLGKMPGRVELNPVVQAQWREDGLIKERVVFAVEEGLSAAAYVFRPDNISGRLPAILVCHGHGHFGKDAVMGVRNNSEIRADIELMNYDYGLQMAKAGYVTIAIDWRGFGERDDTRAPLWRVVGKRDLCDLIYNRASLLGMTVLGMNINDGMCALDYLCQQSYVDKDRIGAMGLSYGGTMTTWMTIMDERIKASDIICYSDMFSKFAFCDLNFCGSQITYGLFDICDIPDLQGLIAPKPLLIEIGSYDECFSVDSAMSCYNELEKIYKSAGCEGKLYLDLFEGGHKFSGKKAFDFFKKNL